MSLVAIRARQPFRIPKRTPSGFCGDPECHEPVVQGRRFCAPHLERLERIREELDSNGDWRLRTDRSWEAVKGLYEEAA